MNSWKTWRYKYTLEPIKVAAEEPSNDFPNILFPVQYFLSPNKSTPTTTPPHPFPNTLQLLHEIIEPQHEEPNVQIKVIDITALKYIGQGHQRRLESIAMMS